MSEILTSLCSILLREYFGEIVQEVGTYLMKQVSACPLFLIVNGVSLPAAKVKSSLCVLIQHNFCEFMQDEKGFVEYTVKKENVLRLLHYERYAYCAQLLYGDPADLLVEEILNHGRLTMSEAIQKVVERLQDAKDATGVDYSSKDIQEKFKLLVESHFLIRCPYPHTPENKSMPNLTIAEHELYIIPQIKLHLLETDNTGESEPKKQKIEFPDSGIYWRINYVRFNQYFRDEAILTACSNYFGEKEAEIVKTILMLADTKTNALTLTTNAIPYYEILQRLTKTINMKSQELDPYLSTLCDGAESFVSKADDRSGGMYVVNIGKILSRLVQSIAISVIQDRFGSKCARVFRIILAKKALEPKQIEELAMLLPRDTKEFIYKLFEESFILAHDVAKGPDFSHGQAIYLLRVDMNQVVRMLLERCYQALFNLITISEKQNQENKRLLEKKQRIDAIVASLKQSGAEEDQIEESAKVDFPLAHALQFRITSMPSMLNWYFAKQTLCQYTVIIYCHCLADDLLDFIVSCFLQAAVLPAVRGLVKVTEKFPKS